jgi:hypothetical protein
MPAFCSEKRRSEKQSQVRFLSWTMTGSDKFIHFSRFFTIKYRIYTLSLNESSISFFPPAIVNKILDKPCILMQFYPKKIRTFAYVI